jgi:5-methylcytosine-specific restriction protein A
VPNRPPSHRPPRLPTPENRPNAHQRGYDHRWKKIAADHLGRHPLCVECLSQVPRRYTAATEVDHIIPHRGDEGLRYDRLNLQSLCKRCHARKTVLYDGGFGRERREKPK